MRAFGLPDDRGVWRGFDIDLAAPWRRRFSTIPAKVTFIPLSSKDRFTALQSGEVDLLSHNTTWTESREVGQGLLFTAINFYDGQGFLVRKSLGISSALKLDGASICAQQGTTNELNLADFFRAHGLKMEPVVFATADEAIKAYDSGRCDAFTTDASGLYAERLKLTHPDENVVLQGDHFQGAFFPGGAPGRRPLVQSGEMDAIRSGRRRGAGRDLAKCRGDEKIARIRKSAACSGVEGDYGAGLGLTPDWAARIVKAVGNYGEIFERNLGKESAVENSARPQRLVARRRAALRPAGAMRPRAFCDASRFRPGCCSRSAPCSRSPFVNARANLHALGIPTSFAFLRDVAGFSINQSLIPFSPLSTYGRALLVGLLNTLLVSVLAGIFATLIGFRRGLRAPVAQSRACRGWRRPMSGSCATCRCCCRCCSAMSPCSRRCRGRRSPIVSRGFVLNDRGFFTPALSFAPRLAGDRLAACSIRR